KAELATAEAALAKANATTAGQSATEKAVAAKTAADKVFTVALDAADQATASAAQLKALSTTKATTLPQTGNDIQEAGALAALGAILLGSSFLGLKKRECN